MLMNEVFAVEFLDAAGAALVRVPATADGDSWLLTAPCADVARAVTARLLGHDGTTLETVPLRIHDAPATDR